VEDHRHSGRIRSTENNTQCFSRKNANTNDEPEIIVHVISHVQVSQIDSENQIKIGHRNLKSQQNDNISRSVGETSLKQEKLQKRSKSTKCYIHFHNFPESSAKNFNVVLHLKVSQIPKIPSKKGTGTWNPSRMTTFQGQSAKRHSNKKN